MGLASAMRGLFDFLFKRDEDKAASKLNQNESDANVDYVVVKTWDDVGEILLDFVEKYNSDVKEYDDYTFEEWYEVVRNLPYIEDTDKLEGCDVDVFCRPKRTLSDDCVARDCDDKAILLACWCHRHRVPYRFSACSYEKNEPVSHCLLEIKKGGKWMPADATYEEDTFPTWRKYHNHIYLGESS